MRILNIESNDLTQIAKIILTDDMGSGPLVYETATEELPVFIAELCAVFNVEPAVTSSITSDARVVNAIRKIVTILPGISVEAYEGSVCASCFSGDAREGVFAEDESVLLAIGKLLKENGFKSKAFDGNVYTGNLTVVKWLEDFRYGFKRRSDEQLAEELQGLLAPEIGAW